MKATTTVTTSNYYGSNIPQYNLNSIANNNNNKQSLYTQTINRQQSIQTVNSVSTNNMNMFISPQQMLKRLIPYSNVQKDKQNIKPRQQNSYQIQSRNILINDIQTLQSQLNNIHAQIIQSQNLLNVRDSLYGQLDLLKQQRAQIQNDINYYQNQFSSTNNIQVNIKNKHSIKQMNQRFRRRMIEVREYIHKMELQNRKIQENINYTNMLNIQKNYRTQVNNSNTWMDNIYLQQRQRGAGRVDDLITRLHMKQQQALDKVRRQQQDINRRNQLNRASFANNTMMNSHMGVRSYSRPSVNSPQSRQRFYSPQYRY